jgi:hypothetical protein
MIVSMTVVSSKDVIRLAIREFIERHNQQESPAG